MLCSDSRLLCNSPSQNALSEPPVCSFPSRFTKLTLSPPPYRPYRVPPEPHVVTVFLDIHKSQNGRNYVSPRAGDFFHWPGHGHCHGVLLEALGAGSAISSRLPFPLNRT